MKHVIVCIVITVILFFTSCELFQLQPEIRNNPRDPGSETAVLYVLSISPEDGTDGVETDSVILVTFSEPLDETTVTANTFTVTTAGSAVS